jgi:glycosyltransferase involved in cell wall biosynthesis
MARLAWFSPMPPVATGVATCSAELVAALGRAHEIDIYVDEPVVRLAPGTRSAHDFIWRHQRQPYDLIVYQVGNSSHHDYQWPYLFRYPGLTVLHDAHLHHARASCLLRTFRADDYRTEFRLNHEEANPDLAELAIAGFDNHLHYSWPMTTLVARTSRVVAVHSRVMADRLREDVPGARVATVHLGHGTFLSRVEEADLRTRTRSRYGIAPDAIVFGCYGGLTRDKRVPQVLDAFQATRASMPSAHLLLAGAPPDNDDLRQDINARRLQDCTTQTGYLPTDEDLTACIAACDVALNLRWPTAREVSGPWLRCLAAAKPTVIVDLAHLVDVPSIDPRTWTANAATPCCVAIDILDEDHSLRLAMRRLATDPALRETLGAAAQQYWSAHHSIDVMVADYRRTIAEAASSPAPEVTLPDHLTDIGSRTLEEVMRRFDLPLPLSAGATARSGRVSHAALR